MKAPDRYVRFVTHRAFGYVRPGTVAFENVRAGSITIADARLVAGDGGSLEDHIPATKDVQTVFSTKLLIDVFIFIQFIKLYFAKFHYSCQVGLKVIFIKPQIFYSISSPHALIALVFQSYTFK